MPNWCEGTLKIREKRKDLIKLLETNLVRINRSSDLETYTNVPININADECDILIKNNDWNNYLYFSNSRRLFPNRDINIWVDKDEEKEQIIYFDVKQAWDIYVDYLQQLSKSNNIDIRIVAYECGMCFSHEIEIHKGNIIIDDTKEYHDDYEWLVDDPSLGG